MGVTGNGFEMRHEQGFEVCTLRSSDAELAVVPELGARIVSLKNRRTGREWMWHPDGGLKLFRNRLGDDFSLSTLTGADECLPTIAPCSWQGRSLPDHGEVWSAAWRVDPAAWQRGLLKTSIALPVSPFQFERTIEVRGNAVRMDYRLVNHSAADERFLWALHPLLRVQPGDQLHLPTATRALFNGAAWIEDVGSAIPAGGCAKVFAGPLTEGAVGVHNSRTSDRLTFEWNPAENNTLGLWLTRGGWHGHHHLALEPTNGAPDPLALAAEQNRCGVVQAGGTMAWSVRLRVES